MTEENFSEATTNVVVLSDRVRNLLRSNTNIKQLIADAIGVDYFTVHRWIKKNDPKITQAAGMKVIREQTGLTDDLILTNHAA